MTTLYSRLHIYLIAAPVLAFCWIVLTDGVSRASLNYVRVSRPAVLLCAAVGAVMTAKAISAIIAGATSASGIITIDTFVNRWAADMLWLALLFLLILLFINSSRWTLRRAIRLVIAMHIAGFAIQLFTYYMFGNLLDFSLWLGGPAARTGYLTFFRPTGFSYEPSTFSSIIILLLACDALVAQRISVRMTLLVATLCILSFSTAAWVFAAFLLFILVPITLKNKFTSLFVVFGFIVIAGLAVQSKYMQVQMAKFEVTSNLRTNIISHALTKRPAWENLFGPPSNGMTLDYYTKTNAYTRTNAIVGRRKPSLAAASSDGTAVYLFVMYGLAGLSVYFVFLFYAYRRLPLPIFLLLFLAMLTKLTPAFMLFTVLASAIFLEMAFVKYGRQAVVIKKKLLPYGA